MLRHDMLTCPHANMSLVPICCDTTCSREASKTADSAGKKRRSETDDTAALASNLRPSKTGKSKGGGGNKAHKNKDAGGSGSSPVRPSDETRRQAAADLKAANMCWDKFTGTSAGACKRYGDKCWAKKTLRLLCPDCKITFHPLCVLKMDKIKNAFCPCHLQEGVTPPP